MKSSLARLSAAISALNDAGEMESFLSELLTPTELRDLVLRWELLELLSQGESQRRIAARLGISLCKITRGAKILKRPDAIATRLLKRPAAPFQGTHHDGTDIAIKSTHKARR